MANTLENRMRDAQNPKLHIVRCLFGLIFFIAYGLPWAWLSLSLVNQSLINFSIEDFYISGVESSNGNSSNSNKQSLIYFKLHIANPNDQVGVYYDNLNLTFSYYTTSGDDHIVPVANYTIPGFRQGRNSKTDRKDYAVMTQGITWQEISSNVSVLSLSPSVSSNVVFRLDLATAVRFRQWFTTAQSKRLEIMAWSDVEVDRITGKKISDEAIKLKHMIINHLTGWIIFAFIILLLATFLSPCLCFLCFCGVSKLLGHY